MYLVLQYGDCCLSAACVPSLPSLPFILFSLLPIIHPFALVGRGGNVYLLAYLICPQSSEPRGVWNAMLALFPTAPLLPPLLSFHSTLDIYLELDFFFILCSV